jgi:hypothetical protein
LTAAYLVRAVEGEHRLRVEALFDDRSGAIPPSVAVRFATMMTRALCAALLVLAACDDSDPGPPDSIPATRFACNATSCDRATEFCYRQQAGVAPATINCNPIPTECNGNATCDCILANTTTACGASTSCQLDEAAVTLTCAAP